ncbi:DUF3616 domain-containing protein [Solirubrobacter phytolaccae]|uniref:DUF3616 domain-containing protein n=1 Tax=Solirubrobacter phytolaccae TaxID=1404360 RepID=A0A9X3S8S3_9ACTN|nr:DUF3616 domain-containing protein [Solirubrobacter phytolaccae]MDA0182554.1 DUF3616 domain-containing protein [Solirubrobacter phytolaccae]
MPQLLLTRRRATAAAVVGALALAAPASAEPVKAGPAVPDELAVFTVGGALVSPGFYSTDGIALHRVSTTDGAYRGRITFPATGDTPLTVITSGATARIGALERSVDGRTLNFPAAAVPAGSSSFVAMSAWNSVRVNADGTTGQVPWGTGWVPSIGQDVLASATVDNSRYWVAAYSDRPFGTIAPGESAITSVATTSALTPAWNVEIADNTLYGFSNDGLLRLPGGGLPTAASTAEPELVQRISGAFDGAFVDTDGVGGSDTLYVSRGVRGLFKYVRSGDAWVQRGYVTGNFAHVTARAVAGAVEIFASATTNAVVTKTVDTAEAGAELVTTGPTTIGRAPSGLRYTGVAFAPGTGFPADSTPYPAAPPTITTATTTVDTNLEAPSKATVAIEVSDPNTPVSELTVTATSNNAASLPSDRITLGGTGHTRTATFDPVAIGSAVVTFTVKAGDDTRTVAVTVRTTGPAPDPTAHYYSGAVDLSANLDVGGDYFLGISDEVNTVHLFKKGVSGGPITSWSDGFPGGETDFEGVTRFGNTVVWSGSHGNNRSGSARPERRFLAFQTISGSGGAVDLNWSHSYTRLWQQWKDWDAANGHGLGANHLKFAAATRPGLIPNAPNGFNVEGLTMAPGSQSVAWFGMRAPTITGADGIERALILPVNNIDKLTDNSVNAELGQPVLLDLGGRSIRDIAKNAKDQYLISAGTGDTDDSIKNWALYTWDGNVDHTPQLVKVLPTDESRIGAWEGIAELPADLVAGSRVLMTADSGDTGLGKSYGQYVTLDAPHPAPALVTGITATAKPGAIDLRWDASDRATAYYITVKDAAGVDAPGTPKIVTGTSATLEPLTAGTEYTVNVRAQNEATRTANGTSVKATPTQGARIATTIKVELVGEPVVGQPLKLVATLSDPAATGTIHLYDNFTSVRGPNNLYDLPVVDGKVEADITDQTGSGVRSYRAEFTSSNPENFLSSQSTITPFVDFRPIQPALKLVSITGDRVAGQPLTLKFQLDGYTKQDIYPGPSGLPVDVRSRVNGATNLTSLGSPYVDEATGVATLTTTQLAAGKHRISGYVGNFTSGVTSMATDEIPLEIAPAGSPAPAERAIKRPKLFLSVSGTRIDGKPVTLTARVSDPTLQGTVYFEQWGWQALGNAPIVNGIATWTGNISSTQPQLMARFEPAADRDTTASAVSPGIAWVAGSGAALPDRPATATTTTLAVEGSRVVGEPLTAKVTVAPTVVTPFTVRDQHGYVELVDGGQVLDLARVIAGKAELDLSGLGAGSHSLVARYVSTDELKSTGSASAAVPVAITVESKTEAPVGGTVGATLALTLGAPASFPAFIPGVEKEYTATTKATVISTAGDATLTVSDPGHLTNGAFSLPQPLRVELGRTAWTGPVSNEDVPVTFKQAIGANDALRTGTYSKTLTFTLSTTTP